MAKDTPERFAKLVLSELADIHALVIGPNDYIIVDIAARTNTSVETIKKEMEAKRKSRADRFLADLLARVDLPNRSQQ